MQITNVGRSTQNKLQITTSASISARRLYAAKLHAKVGHEKDPIPSPSCVALQFHPRCPTHLSAGRFSSRFKVKRQVQSRILRKCNPDSHACNALAKYQKTKTVEVRDLARELDAKRAAGLCPPCMHARSTLTLPTKGG